jgi:anti-sigma-K factor RskA
MKTLGLTILFRLTGQVPAARSRLMQFIGQGMAGSWRRASGAASVVLVGATMVSGCISVNAPDKPIVIELNINIKQDVVYSLAPDAKKTIDSNSGIF